MEVVEWRTGVMLVDSGIRRSMEDDALRGTGAGRCTKWRRRVRRQGRHQRLTRNLRG